MRPTQPLFATTSGEDADRLMVARTLAGEPEAFEGIVARHQAAVQRVAARIVGASDASDVTQEAFLRSFDRLHQFRNESPFRAWILQITRNTALTWADARCRGPVCIESYDVSAPRRLEPIHQLEAAERERQIVLDIRKLTPEHRAVLILRDLEGLTYIDIASITNSPIGSVKGRLHRARNELIGLLGARSRDWDQPRYGTPTHSEQKASS